MPSRVDRVEEVVNTFDNHGPAYKITLSCGHQFHVTGSKIFNIKEVNCKHCGENGEVIHWH